MKRLANREDEGVRYTRSVKCESSYIGLPVEIDLIVVWTYISNNFLIIVY